ncbi:MAG: nitrous oxide reductase accessory protein NosL [Epsilonproteobacteria bacterium]|nr:nitrous oxide reductase accessory protein NosL [Campylobacterota bacterium]
MKKIVTLSIVALIFAGCMSDEVKPKVVKSERFQSVAMEQAVILQTGEHKHACPECGMKLPMFYKSNHAATSNGKVKQYCSIHCLVDDKTNKKSDVKEMKVVAVDTLKFIDVKEATYVVGSDVRGTMSGLSKYAFEGRMSARRFVQEHQGKIMSFDEAYAYALKDFE